MSLLQIVADACDLIGIPRPGSVASSADQTARQLMTLATRSGRSLMKRHDWTALQTEATWATKVGEDQGTVESLMPGFDRLINRTGWNRTNDWPLGGPVSPQYWQQLEALTELGPSFSFRIRGGRLRLIPAPTSTGATIGIEYVTRYWLTDATGATGRDRWLMDTDVSLLDEDLLTVDLVWRFKQAKGFDYEADQAAAERMILDAISRDGSRRTLDMANASEPGLPVIQAPEGSWQV